jgi:hypothetical protein
MDMESQKSGLLEKKVGENLTKDRCGDTRLCTPALRRWMQENFKFETILNYIVISRPTCIT